MRTIIIILITLFTAISANAKTLIAYYSYTNNVHKIVTELQRLTGADIVRIEPSEKGLDYAANNYAIGSAQIAAIRNNPNDASSYPAIDPVNLQFDQYDTFIIAAPLWWSNMAAPFQTFLFQHGKEMAGKNVGLIVSSASSGISGVEEDAKRLIPQSHLLSPSLWIRSSQTSNAKTLLENWLKTINYDNLTSGIENINGDIIEKYTVYSLSGIRLLSEVESIEGLANGIYIINGKKKLISK